MNCIHKYNVLIITVWDVIVIIIVIILCVIILQMNSLPKRIFGQTSVLTCSQHPSACPPLRCRVRRRVLCLWSWSAPPQLREESASMTSPCSKESASVTSPCSKESASMTSPCSKESASMTSPCSKESASMTSPYSKASASMTSPYSKESVTLAAYLTWYFVLIWTVRSHA